MKTKAPSKEVGSESDHRCSPWAWPGFNIIEEVSIATGAWWDDAAAAAGFPLGRGNRPAETPFAQALRKLLDANQDGQTSEDELDAALRHRATAPLIGSLITRHRSAWDVPTWEERYAALETVATQIGSDAARHQIINEKPRVLRLQWWNLVAAGVEGFPKDSNVYHFHPVGLAGAFGSISSLDELIRKIGDIISHGEGSYESYNSGTKGVPGGRVGHSFIRPAEGTVTSKTINEIIATESLSGLDKNRLFATGKYQTVIPTLREAKQKLRISGDELYDAKMQERVFRDYLFEKAGGGELAYYVKRGKGTIDAAMHAASKEWASIAAPAGYPTQKMGLSDGTLSFYESPANHANIKSTQMLREILREVGKTR